MNSVWFISPYERSNVWWHLQDSRALQPPQLSVSLYLEAPGDTGPSYDVIPTCTCYWAQLHVTWGQAVFHAIDTLAIMLRDRLSSAQHTHPLAHPSFWYYRKVHAVHYSSVWPIGLAHLHLTPVWRPTPDPRARVASEVDVSFNVLGASVKMT